MADNNGKAANPVVFFDVALGGKHGGHNVLVGHLHSVLVLVEAMP